MWTLAYLFGFLFCIDILLRARTPEIWSVVAAQGFIFMTAYLNLLGARAYIGNRPLRHGYAACAVSALIALSVYFTTLHPNPDARFAVMSLVGGILFLLSARTIARGDLQRLPARYLFALPCAGHGLFLLVWGNNPLPVSMAPFP